MPSTAQLLDLFEYLHSEAQSEVPPDKREWLTDQPSVEVAITTCREVEPIAWLALTDDERDGVPHIAKRPIRKRYIVSLGGTTENITAPSPEEAAEQAVPPANFTDSAYLSSRTDGQLFYQILMGGGERCAMPAYGPESSHGWTEEKVWRMVAFVRRFAQPAGD